MGDNAQYTTTSYAPRMTRFCIRFSLALFYLALACSWAVAQEETGAAPDQPLPEELVDVAPAAEEVSAQPAEAASDMKIRLESAGPVELPKDVVLVLDNSGSMKQNDPQRLAPEAVRHFIENLGDVNRLAVIIFDQDVRLAVPLSELATRRGELLASLDQINYKGLYTNIPDAIERAIYELKINGRPDAEKLIVFMTDGIVDTGKPERDREKAAWLREELAADAERSGIQIFGVAFTEQADFQLIQSLTSKSGGEYYRAFAAADLQSVFERVNAAIRKPVLPPQPPPVIEEPVVRETLPEPEPAPPPAAPPQPIIIEVPAQPVFGAEEQRRLIIIVTAAVAFFAVLLAILFLLVRRGKAGAAPEAEYEPKAYLSDLHNVTGKPSYELGRKPTMLGRVAGADIDHIKYVVIPETTVGRRHALIEYKDYAYWIVDQGSINGTFVNDKPVTAEVRLKHGDRIRLHKYEFEFVMPELMDSGMTVVSATRYAQAAEDKTVAPAAAAAADQANMDELIDVTGGADEATVRRQTPESVGSEDATIAPGMPSGPEPAEDATIAPGAPVDSDEDVTLRPDTTGGTDPLSDFMNISSGTFKSKHRKPDKDQDS
jgi:Mg-chelatase subunit ChlD